MQNLNIAFIQSCIFWEFSIKNISYFDFKFSLLSNNINLVVLPEMFTTGFSMDSLGNFQNMNGQVIKWLIYKSFKIRINIAGTLIIKSNNKYYNRFIWITPNKKLFFYDKKHLFCYAGEDRVYCSGNRRNIIDCLGWKIYPFICYDIRFPIWERNFSNKYDLLLFVANWPLVRVYAWRKLIISRAIENQSYVIGVNRIGKDKIRYSGGSLIIGPHGSFLTSISLKDIILEYSLSYYMRENFFINFPVLKDSDSNLFLDNF